MVFGHGDGLISDLARPALKKLANELIGFDDDDATPEFDHEGARGLSLLGGDYSRNGIRPPRNFLVIGEEPNDCALSLSTT